MQDLLAINTAIASPDLQNLGLTPQNREHNTRASLLRKGLYVVAFNTLENFLKRRTSEHLETLRYSLLTFNQLPLKLQNAAVEDAIKSALKQASFDKTNGKSILQEAAAAVASTAATSSFEVHKYSFLHANSNISVEDISSATGALHIKDPWGEMQIVLSRIGVGGLPLNEQFKSALTKRNIAAHSDQSVERTDLEGLVAIAAQLACAFDIVFAAGISRLLNNEVTGPTDQKVEITKSIKMELVEYHPRGWSRLNRNGRPIRYYPDMRAAMSAGLSVTVPPNVVVARSAPLGVADWMFADARVPR